MAVPAKIKNAVTRFRDNLNRMSIRGKLMMSLCLTSLLILVLVWFAVANLLQPAYNRYINATLNNRIHHLAIYFDEAAANGEDISERDLTGLQLNGDFWSDLNGKLSDGEININDNCVDIADSTLQMVNYVEHIQPCLLHGSNIGRFGETGIGSDLNSGIVMQLRRQVFEKGQVSEVLERGDKRQMVVGRLVADGQYSIIISANLARIEEAGQVMGDLLPPLAFVLFIVSVLLSLAISYLVAAPLTQLSAAARKVAAGDYDVVVPERGSDDEMDLLARDFNHMTAEVKKTSLLQQQLLANVSHDLRTPLTLIRGYAETVRDISGDDKNRRDEQMDIIIDETSRLSSLVNSVMEYSKVSSGTERPEKVRFDMSELGEEVAERYDAVCEQKHYTLEQKLEPAMVYADPGMIERVLHNLLGNAMHHIGADGWFALRVLALPEGGCRVEVSDHGPGIKQEDLAHLFDRYYRSRSDSGKVGTGLGLSISKAIFQSHGFKFGVDTELGKGSTFWFVMTDEHQAPELPEAESGKEV